MVERSVNLVVSYICLRSVVSSPSLIFGDANQVGMNQMITRMLSGSMAEVRVYTCACTFYEDQSVLPIVMTKLWMFQRAKASDGGFSIHMTHLKCTTLGRFRFL